MVTGPLRWLRHPGVRRRRSIVIVAGTALVAGALAASLTVTLRGRSAQLPTGPYVRTCGTSFCTAGGLLRVAGANSFALVFRPGCDPAVDQETIVRSVAQAGMTVIRLPLYQELVEPTGDFSRFDSLVALARRYHVYLFPDLEDENATGATSCYAHRPSLPISWYRNGYQKVGPGHVMSYTRWVTTVLTRYRDEPAIFAWSLLNEPVAMGSPCDPAFYDFFATMTRLAHRLDPNHLVDVGSGGPGLPGWSCSSGPDRYDSIAAIPGNDFSEVHDYSIPPCTADLRCVPYGVATMLSTAQALNRPLLVAELGIKREDSLRQQEMVTKVTQEVDAGAAGVLLWDVQMHARGRGISDYSVAAGDPLLGRFAAAAGAARS